MSASGGSTHAPVRCLYVALDVPRNASPADIKKAYRKQALAWHPDKNVGNEAEARVRFQELQHAYAVLSDPHERRWYDDHRDEILNPERYAGGDGNGDFDDEKGSGRTVNLTKFFSAAAFSGFGDDGTGFYQTYERAFREVWDSERDWREGEASTDAEGWGRGDPPEMGRSGDGYEVAEAFYSSWSGFVSGLSFGWVDDYNINEAESRRVRRLMEKENTKKRAVARKKYQDDVRTLVEFCRRRDRRVIKHKLALAKEKKAREKEKEEEARVKRENMKRRKEEWARVRQEEQAVEEEKRALEGANKAFRLGETDSEEEEQQQQGGGGKKQRGKRRTSKRVGGGGGVGGVQEQEVTVFRCAVCKKDFKSRGQMSNHETSKAHKKKLEELDEQMLRETLASAFGEEEEIDEVDSDSDFDNYDQDKEEEDEEVDFFVDSAKRELRESEFDGKASEAGGSGEKEYVVGARDTAQASEEGVRPQRQPKAKSNGSRESKFGFGDRGDHSNTSSSDSSGKEDSEEDPTFMAAFARASVAEAEEGDIGGNCDNKEAKRNQKGAANPSARMADGVEISGTTVKGFSLLSSPRLVGLSEAKTASDEDRRESGGDDGVMVGTGHSPHEGSDGSGNGVAERDHGLKKESSGSVGKRGRRKAGGNKRATESVKVSEGGPAAADKGARRRRRQAVKTAKGGRVKGSEEDEGLGCRVCGRRFSSRSKLFAHVKTEGHAVLV